VMAIGRLRSGVPAATAAAEIAAMDTVTDGDRDPAKRRALLGLLPLSRVGGDRYVVAGFAGALLALVSLILAAACANVASVALARSAARRRDLALRVALGARRGRLVRQLLAETVLLFLIGGTAGLVLARLILAIAPRAFGLAASVAVPVVLDFRVAVFAFSLSFVAALLTGVLPAWRASKTDPVEAIKGGAGSIAGRSRLRSTFVIAQIAFSVLIVALAGLFVRAVRHAGAANPGFDPRGVEVATVNLAPTDADEPTRAAVWREVLARVRALPTVQATSLARVPPGGWEGIGLGAVSPAGASASVSVAPGWNIVDPGYFETLRIPLIDGRDFRPTDTTAAPAVAIVSEQVARQLWPGRRAVGQWFVRSEGQEADERRIPAEVIGVVRDIKSSSVVDGLAAPYVYLPRDQSPADFTTNLAIVARSRDGRRLAGEIAGVIHDVNPNLVVTRSDTLGDAMAFGLAPQRVFATVAGVLGLIGLLLACIGVYGVVAFTVARRRREFGIRMALGAPRFGIAWMVLRQGQLLVAIGTLAGLGLAAIVGQVLSVFLYDLPGLHAPTFAGTALLFVLVGAAACSIPARSAVRIEPLRALRDD